MALNDFLRIVRNVGGGGSGFSFELQNPPGGTQKAQVRQGYIILPPDPLDENATEIGSIWYNSSTGKIRIHDAISVRDL